MTVETAPSVPTKSGVNTKRYSIFFQLLQPAPRLSFNIRPGAFTCHERPKCERNGRASSQRKANAAWLEAFRARIAASDTCQPKARLRFDAGPAVYRLDFSLVHFASKRMMKKLMRNCLIAARKRISPLNNETRARRDPPPEGGAFYAEPRGSI